jgi:hypothetical protein
MGHDKLPLPRHIDHVVNKIIPKHVGSSKEPTITFNNDSTSGWYMDDDNNIVFTSSGSDNIIQSSQYTEFKTAIVLNDYDVDFDIEKNSGVLYKKPDTGGLWWVSNGIETDLVSGTHNKIVSLTDSGSVKDFANSSNDKLDRKGVGNSDKLEKYGIDKDIYLTNIPELSESVLLSSDGLRETTKTGVLYKKPDDKGLWWRVNNKSTDILNYKSVVSGSDLEPAFSFTNDTSTGLFRSANHEISITAGGNTVASFGSTVDIKSHVNIYDSENNFGSLYKKAGSDTLWWNINGKDVALTNGVGGSVNDAKDSGVSNDKDVSNVGDSVIGSVSNVGILDNVVKLQSNLSDVAPVIFDESGIVITTDNSDSSKLKEMIDSIKEEIIVLRKDIPTTLPEYNFSKSLGTGMFLDDGDLVLKSLGDKVITISNDGVLIGGSISIQDNNKKTGSIFKTNDSNDLFWSVGSEIYNLTSHDYNFPSDKGTGMYLAAPGILGFSASNSMSLAITDSGTIFYNSLNIKDSKCSAPALSDEGHLYKKPGNTGLFWNTLAGDEIDLTKTIFPLHANNGSASLPTYSFTNDISTGLYLSESGILGLSADGIIALEITANSILASVPIEIKDLPEVNVSSNLSSGVVSSNLSSGVVSSSGKLYKQTGTKSLIWNVDGEEIDISSKNIPVNIPDVNQNNVISEINNSITRCENNIKLQPTWTIDIEAGERLKAGDIVGYNNDLSETVYKSIGGKWENISYGATGNYCKLCKLGNSSVLFTINAGNNATLTATWLDNIAFTDSYTINTNLDSSNVNTSIVQLDDKWYVLVVSFSNLEKSNIIHCKFQLEPDLHKILAQPLISSEIDHPINAIDSTYDLVIDTIITVLYIPDLSNYNIILLKGNSQSNNALELGQIHENVSNDPIIDIAKQLHVLSLPGQVLLISYGNRKTTLLVTGWNSSITYGETIIEYESFDCVDMIYDVINGLVITLESTITPSCFIQAMDILGTKIQRLTTRNFKNQTMEPFSILYNTTGYYNLLFSDVCGNISMQLLQFDGEEFISNMKYDVIPDLGIKGYNSASRSGKWLFPLDKENILAVWPTGNGNIQLAKFIDGYHGYPNAFIGMATNDTDESKTVTVMPIGFIYTSNILLNSSYLGKKLYLVNFNNTFPNNIGTSGGSFIGTCLSRNKILLGL